MKTKAINKSLVIDIKTRRAFHAKDIEDAAARQKVDDERVSPMPADAVVPAGLNPIIEQILLEMRDLDEEDRQDILRKAIKLKNTRSNR